ncbi:phosphohydrolase [Pediococcus stilesii]|uniref:Phosphohydrolase n=1 Tax=Pediococcus stilesii TaxID=331679 RepID=A0A0R2KYS8_9LACO|nr:phosphohydrolase [Pediococcus stilesii]
MKEVSSLRIAATSDNHFDVNKIDENQMVKQQAKFLLENKIDVYLIAGDLFNKFNRTLDYVETLQKLVAPQIKVFFIAGNHDMLNDISYEGLETDINSNYLHNKFYDVPDTNWRIVGNNGWYDYTFADNVDKTNDQFWRWKKSFWIDTGIDQPVSDIERMDNVLKQTEALFKNAKGKNVVFMTHFAVSQSYIHYTNDGRFWNMANGMMGSKRMEKLLDQYQPQVVISGHLHHHFKPLAKSGGIYYNNSVGYHNNRINEWSTDDFFTEWTQRLLVLDLG